MKSFGFIALLFVISSQAFAELDTLWYRQLQLAEFSYPPEAATVLQNGSVMVAAPTSNGGVVALWRYSLDGSLEWSGSVTYPGSGLSILGLKQYVEGQLALFVTYWSQEELTNIVHLKRFTVDGVELGDDLYNLNSTSWTGGLAALADNTMMLMIGRGDVNGFNRIFLTKFNVGGDTLWSRQVDLDASYSEGRSVSEFENGDLLLAGTFSDTSFSQSAFVMRVTSEGSTIWTNTYASAFNFMLVANSTDIDRNGNVVVGGTDGGFWGGGSRPWAVGLDENGDLRWELTGVESIEIGVNGIKSLIDGGAVIAGTPFSDFGFFNSEIYSVDESGQPNFEMTFDAQTQIRAISNDGPRGSILFGSRLTDQNQNEGLLMRFGPTTLIQGFVRAQGTNLPLEGVRVEFLETHEFAYSDIQGIYNLGVSETQGTLRLTSPCTTPLQQTVTLVEGEQNVHNFTLGIPRFDNPVSSVNLVVTFNMWNHDTLTVYNDGNGTLVYTTEAVQQVPTNYTWLGVSPASGEIPPNSSAEIVISIGPNSQFPDAEFYGEVRIHHNACPDTVNEIGVYSLALDSPERPGRVESFNLHPAYPNPFNAETRVAFDLPQTAQVTAKLYSIQGREVATLTDRVYDAGSHELNFSGSNLATGVYLLRLSAGQSVATQKLVLLK